MPDKSSFPNSSAAGMAAALHQQYSNHHNDANITMFKSFNKLLEIGVSVLL